MTIVNCVARFKAIRNETLYNRKYGEPAHFQPSVSQLPYAHKPAPCVTSIRVRRQELVSKIKTARALLEKSRSKKAKATRRMLVEAWEKQLERFDRNNER